MSQLLREAGVKTPQMGLSQLPTILDNIVEYNNIATIDATSYFFQIPLHVELRKYFGILVAVKRGQFRRRRLRVLPMGLSWSPAIAQHLATFFVDKIQRNFPTAYATVWVDNFILGAHSDKQLNDMMSYADTLFHKYGLVTKSWITGLQIEVLGFHVSQTPHGLTVQIKDPDIFSIEHWKNYMQHLDILRLAGKIIFANYAIIRRPLAFLPSLLESVRKASTRLFHHDSQLIEIPTELITEIQDLKRWWDMSPTLTRMKKPRLLPITNTSWSDASTHTVAVVHETSQHDLIGHITHTPVDPKQVYLLELLAILFAAKTTTSPREIVTDSQIAARALVKGHTHSALGNELIAHILQEDVFKSVRWVDTTKQRADPITRGQDIPLPRIATATDSQALVWKARAQG